MNKENQSNRLVIWLLSVLTVAFVLTQSKLIGSWLSFIINILKPLFWALGIAYLLNPILKWFESKTRFGRGVSVTIIYLLLLFFIANILMFIIPLSYNSAMEIVKEAPNYSQSIEKSLEESFTYVKSLERLAQTYNIDIIELIPNELGKWLNEVNSNAQNMLLSFGGAIFSFTSGLFKFVMGLILSIYLLLEKEKSLRQAKRLLITYLGREKAEKLFELLREADETFSKYLIGKMLDSLVIGILCYIGLRVLAIRFPVLFSLIVGVTNMIPYFGPFIGAIPVILVTLFYSPIKALWAAIFILVLQQADGNFIGPMILGGQVGISPMLIIVAVIVGGGLFGVVGMLFCVPVMALMKNILTRHVNSVLGE